MTPRLEYTSGGTVGLIVPRESTTVEPELSVLLAPEIAILATKMPDIAGTPFETAPALERRAVIDQYSRGTKARISRSRSTINRTATDCTRPAESPPRTFAQSSGEIL